MLNDEQPSGSRQTAQHIAGSLSPSQYEILIKKFGATDFGDQRSLGALMQVYSGAMREVRAKLENLDEEFSYRSLPNPIHHIEYRLKSVESILGKLHRRGLPMTLEGMRNNLRDIAGIRVICNYIDDVYAISDMIAHQSDVNILRIKDYIKNPKPNGYRSLHVILTVPVFLSDGPHVTPVEVQFRTIAMDYWASLEHELRYKNNIPDKDIAQHSATLLACAHELAHVEGQMDGIHHDIEKDAQKTLEETKRVLPRKIDVHV